MRQHDLARRTAPPSSSKAEPGRPPRSAPPSIVGCRCHGNHACPSASPARPHFRRAGSSALWRRHRSLSLQVTAPFTTPRCALQSRADSKKVTLAAEAMGGDRVADWTTGASRRQQRRTRPHRAVRLARAEEDPSATDRRALAAPHRRAALSGTHLAVSRPDTVSPKRRLPSGEHRGRAPPTRPGGHVASWLRQLARTGSARVTAPPARRPRLRSTTPAPVSAPATASSGSHRPRFHGPGRPAEGGSPPLPPRDATSALHTDTTPQPRPPSAGEPRGPPRLRHDERGQ